MFTPFKTQRRVEFCETDAAGIAHFAAFFTYMEQAEHALFRHLGLSVVLADEAGVISWPRVSATCDYHGAVKFEDILDIAVRVEKLGTRSVTYSFVFTRDTAPIATGRITAVCCRIEPNEAPRSIDIPARIGDRLREFLETEPQS